MHFTTRFTMLAAMVVAMLIAPLLGGATTASAQTPPATFYGKGLRSGDRVEAFIGGRSCGAATANTAGEWSISVAASAACGPTAGAPTAFTLNGEAATASPAATWQGGGLPPDVANGYVLAQGGATATPTGAAPVAPKTGNAGLLRGDEPATSGWVLAATAVGVLAAVAAGRRLATRHR